MTEETGALEAGLGVFAGVLIQIEQASIEIMRVHPVNSLLMMNLLGNIGYALFAVPETDGTFTIGQWGLTGDIISPKFDSRQELMSYIFRRVAAHSGAMMSADVVKDLFSAFNLGKLIGALK